ncbi:tubulin-like doman-containing protein [Salinigranum halophilum]|uniref:tubulin-like doman-containing protein n=1 Tax=Salinigranum halophilum TaxID=2565931 RepID=UPI001375F40D|nr:tubulin-like doman-containing protein [Salinigranum halophilum]
MSQEWILNEVLKSDEYNDDPDRLRATLIDSATGDDWHKERAARAIETIEDAITRSGNHPGGVDVSFDGPQLITEELPPPWQQERLTDPVEIRELFDTQGLNSWWLQQDREPLSHIEREGFGGGVWRRRAVGKALYHVSEHTGHRVAPYTSADDEVVIVAALGGGTGSGMALDLAADLQSNRTHLFAILPHVSEPDFVKMNSHAALSELEYAQLTSDNPFSTITLIPHLELLDDKGRDFEMAVVRSILAHQNLVQTGCGLEEVIPGSPGGPRDYAPFTLAVPYTVRYDVRMRRIAGEELEERLARKREELRREADLYTVVETYLKRSFAESAGEALEQTEQGVVVTDIDPTEAYQLRERIEADVRDTFLEQRAFRVAGLGDELEEVHEVLDDILDDEQNLGITAEDPIERAQQFISTAPEMLRNQLEDHFDYVETDGHLYTLVEVLKQEFDNIERRARLWNAIGTITGEETQLDEQTATDIRRALREGILSPDVTFLDRVLTDPTIDQRLAHLDERRDELQRAEDELHECYDRIADELGMRTDEWRYETEPEASVLTAIHEHEEAVNETLERVAESITDAVRRVENAESEAEVERVTLDLDEIDRVNEKLDEMDVSEIDVQSLGHAFEQLKQTRQYQLEHSGGLLGGLLGRDREEEFLDVALQVEHSDWFRFQGAGHLSVSEPLSYELNAERLDRSREIRERWAAAADAIVDGFDRIVLADPFEGILPKTPLLEEFGELVRVPVGEPHSVLRALEADLDDQTAVTTSTLFDKLVPHDVFDVSTPVCDPSTSASRTAAVLFDVYLQSVGQQYEDVVAERRYLDENDTGLIHRLEALLGLSASPDNVRVAVPTAHDVDGGRETYGRTFANRYEGIYEIPLPEEADFDDGRHPYVVHERSEPEDVGDADHIGESDILENHTDRITQHFVNSLRALKRNEHGRAPLNDLFPQGSGNSADVGGSYTAMRYRSVYMSRALDSVGGLSYRYDNVHEQIKDITLNAADIDVYGAETYDSGGPDDITMTLFIGGVFLDNIELLTRRGGYKDKYDEKFSKHEFIGTHHTIGLGARWNRWDTMEADAHEAAVSQAFDDGAYGAYVYRDEVRDVDGQLVDELMIADNDETKDAKDVLLDMLSVDAYESTIPFGDES